MAIKMPPRKVSDTENKLRVLLCLRELGSATAEQLWPFVSEMGFMDYVPYCLLLGELEADGAIAAGAHAMQGMLYLTERGETTLEMFLDKLPPADRERVAKAAPAHVALLNERRQARAAHELPQGELRRARFGLWENGVQVLSMRLRTPNAALTQAAVSSFRRVAPLVTNTLYTLEFTPDSEPLPILPTLDEALDVGEAALVDMGGGAYAAAVCLEMPDMRLDIALLMPTREGAQGWAKAALARKRWLCDRLTGILNTEAQP